MTQGELYLKLKTLGIPVAYGVFEEKQIPPYLVFARDHTETTSADDKVHAKQEHYTAELYDKKRNLKLEGKIEKLFDENEIIYEASEIYLPDEKLREVIYEFYIYREESK